MDKFAVHTGVVMPLDRGNVDTDQIIPKQFLKSIKRSGFGPNLFDEWRYLDPGEPGQDPVERRPNPWFVLNQERYAQASILLARENRDLKDRVYRASMAAAAGPAVDDVLPAVPVTDLDGLESELVYDDPSRDSVVLVFTTTCPACHKNLERWRDLHQRYGESYRFVAVGLDPADETRRWAEQNDVPFEVVIPADRSSFQRDYGISSVPQTLVVGNDGRVKLTGVLSPRFQDQLG